jgi:radical S-adenosyl methionine domain-containing protein 2
MYSHKWIVQFINYVVVCRKRDARGFVIANDEFNQFLDRHRHLKCLVPEDNENMRNSYLILDEEMRFLNCQTGKVPTQSIFDVGVQEALKQSGFDPHTYVARGAVYDWTATKEPSLCSTSNPLLEW